MATSNNHVIDLFRDMGEMDGDNDKVFVSKININSCTSENNFYDILWKEVKEPLKPTLNKEVQDECEFKPRVNKYYVPKKKSKLKVYTVREIRNHFEKEMFETLPLELEKQEKFLLKKIRGGYFNDKETKNIALKLLTSDKPLSRTSWQMLMNLNPKGHTHSSQFILWNGHRVQVSGSRGGKNKFICNYDVKNDQEPPRKSSEAKKKTQTRRALLRDSLNIRFKPGPLQKKKDLDDSYQKYNVGEIKVVNLPEIGLHIQPSYGTALEPTITTFLQNTRALDGTISEKWAEFASSVLGKATEEGVKIESEKSVIFNLNYKYDQKRILMRNDFDSKQSADDDTAPMDVSHTTCNEDLLTRDIKFVVSRILDSVEISLNQHSMYSGEEEPREIHKDTCNIPVVPVKEKEKKRKYCELDRLDVTVIRISEKSKRKNSEPCQQLFCSLGCICDSLECAYQIKDHCGKIECMFGCNCDFSKFKIADSLEGNCSEFIPGLVYLDKKINDKLAKEEQKFHQTVIVTDDKSILLKSRRRNWKTSKKYADFYSGMRLRANIKNQKFPQIIISKLQCENIEPWCMVHNLYKCFCKGKFVQSFVNDSTEVDTIPSTAYKDRGAVPIIEKTPPILEKTLPGLNKLPPVLEKAIPVSEKTLPDLEKTVPVLERNQPVVENTPPVLEKAQPVLEKTLPVLEKTQPVLEKSPPVLEQTLPVLDKTEPVLEKMISVLVKTQPVLEKTMPVLEKTKPVLDKTKPVSEKTKPVLEKTLSDLEKTSKCSENHESITANVKSIANSSDAELPDSVCARTLPLYSRKFSDEYYHRTNEKIFEMEKNDKKLHTKLMTLIKGMEGSEQTDVTQTQCKNLDLTDKIVESNESPINIVHFDEDIDSSGTVCARMFPFERRKYNDGYYRKKNARISKLEKRDKTLKSKLMSLINSAKESEQTDVTQTQDKVLDVIDTAPNANELPTNALFEQEKHVPASASVSKIGNKKPKTKLMKWLETNLTKDFLETIEKGSWTTSLSRPSLGKVALYPWKFILSRYRERKNLFLLTTQQPFRIFMAVNTSYSFFDNCINVSDIPISRIGEYPDMVRSLISNANHDSFCILSGLAHCWELVGSVNKVNKDGDNKTNPDNIHESIFNESSYDSRDVRRHNILDDINLIEDDECDADKISKWFIMTIEDDVNELRFFRKGFFVKYDSIIRSINIARKIGKTVRLFSQNCDRDTNGPRFGIYATADRFANTLFIGPYEEHEPLGIETTRSSQENYDDRQTGGLWITVNKRDNVKVTENPLLFLPSIKNDSDSIVTIDSDSDSDSDSIKKKDISSSSENADLSDEKSSSWSNAKVKSAKLIKPITIRKTDSFYPLGSQGLIKQFAFTKHLQQSNNVPGSNNIAPIGPYSPNKVPVKPLEIPQLGSFEHNSKPPFNKPVAEIAPQIKINNISSLCSKSYPTELTPIKRKSEGMFVLKPEEINKRLANNYFRILEPIEIEDSNSDEILSTGEKNLDVEEFLDLPHVSTAPPDIYVISDDEDDCSRMSIGPVIKNVWITCSNIPNIGWISGRRNNDKKLSFEFPGFATSDYYDEEEALDKINQLLSRKVCIPKNVQAKWQVTENEEDLLGKEKLRKEDLCSDFVLTRRGLLHKDKLIFTDKRNRKESNNGEKESAGCCSQANSPAVFVEVEEPVGSEKIINADNLSNENNIKGKITAVASTSIDADGNDQGIKIYRITSNDLQKKDNDEDQKKDKSTDEDNTMSS